MPRSGQGSGDGNRLGPLERMDGMSRRDRDPTITRTPANGETGRVKRPIRQWISRAVTSRRVGMGVCVCGLREARASGGRSGTGPGGDARPCVCGGVGGSWLKGMVQTPEAGSPSACAEGLRWGLWRWVGRVSRRVATGTPSSGPSGHLLPHPPVREKGETVPSLALRARRGA